MKSLIIISIIALFAAGAQKEKAANKRKQADGNWKCVADIWNADPAGSGFFMP